MEEFRIDPPKTIAETRVLSVSDFQKGITIDVLTKEESKIVLPKANVLLFKLESVTQIALRPSGTDPKIKYYFSVNQEFNSQKTWEEQEIALEKRLDRFENSFKAL